MQIPRLWTLSQVQQSAASTGAWSERLNNCRVMWGMFLVPLMIFATGSLLAGEPSWPQFRGPKGDGIAEVESSPVSWSVNKNIVWKRDLPGRGWSSPVVSEGLVWMTTAVEVVPTEEEKKELLKKNGTPEKDFGARQIASKIDLKVLAVEWATGELVHEIDLFQVAEPDAIHALNSYASPTPVIDGDGLYCHFGTFGTAAVSRHDGKVTWRKVLPLEHSVGPGSSPYVEGNLLVLICDGCDRQYVTALDKSTGDTVWEKDRPEMDAPDGDRKKSFDTPIGATDASGRRQLICMGSQWIVAYDPPTGNELWKVYHGKGFSVVPRPVVGNDIVYFSTGFGKPELWGVRIDGTGDVTESHVVWKESKSIPAKPSPLLSNGRLYVIEDKGVASCFQADDGTLLWKERIAGNYSASPLLADGKIYFSSQEGVTTVIADSAEFEKLGENTLPGTIMASPLALENSLLIRTDTTLFRVADATQPSNSKPASTSDSKLPPVRLFLLVGQSNMEGKAKVSLLKNQAALPETSKRFAHLLNPDGSWVEREDVLIKFLDRKGKLTVGYGSPDRIGPELDFGHVVGNHYEEPVLIIKSAWGGKSLFRDFRPPSSGLPADEVLEQLLTNARKRQPNTTLDDIKQSFGHYYRATLDEYATTLKNRDELFPELKGRDAVLSGIVWFQGWNDMISPEYTAEYAVNMAHFIRDIRRDLKAPNVPFVIGQLGVGGTQDDGNSRKTAFKEAQAAPAELPEFAGNVAVVKTDQFWDMRADAVFKKGWKEHLAEWEAVGSDYPFHYLGSPTTYSDIGRAFGESVLMLQPKESR